MPRFAPPTRNIVAEIDAAMAVRDRRRVEADEYGDVLRSAVDAAEAGGDDSLLPSPGQHEHHHRLTRGVANAQAELDDLITESVEIHRAETERAEARQEILRAAAGGGGNGWRVESADGASVLARGATAKRSTGFLSRAFRASYSGAPWSYHGELPTSGEIVRSNALKALDILHDDADVSTNPDALAMTAEIIERSTSESDKAAVWAVASSHPDYLTAFRKLIRNPTGAMWALSDAERSAVANAEIARAALSLTDANGGYLVPFTLDPTIILTNAGIADPIRSISTVKQIATDTWNGVTSAGVTAEWLDEATEAADATPTVGQPSIAPQKGAAWLFGSHEVLADSGFAGELSMLLADAKARLEGAAFATGNTGASVPRGVVAAVAAVTASIVSSATITAFVAGDVYRVSDALRPRDASQASWIANKRIYSLIRQMDTAGGSAFWANMGMGVPSMLLGQPQYECSTMASVITTSANVLLAGNFKQYYIVDRLGTQMYYEPLIKGSNQRPTGQAGWYFFWRTGADTVDAGAFRLLQLHTTPGFTALA